jgi:biopolymer transport protein ExbB
MESLVDIYHQGGVVMIPLFIFSVLIWTVVLQKVWFIYNFNTELTSVSEHVDILLKEQKKKEALEVIENSHPLIQKSFGILFEEFKERELWENRIARRAQESFLEFRKNMWILGTIAPSAPFIGLFGTVVGIIKSFDSIAQTNEAGFAVVSKGLSEALVATAAGILVAVMAVIFYNYFQTKLKNLNLVYKNKLMDIAEHFSSKS